MKTEELNKILEKEKKVVISFEQEFCPFCRKAEEDLKDIGDDIKYVRIDASESQDLMDKLNISATPTLLVIKDGKLKRKIIGYTKSVEDYIKELFSKL